MQRDHKFDFIKGVLILLVVWGHVISADKMACGSVVFNVIYSFHMPLFVFVSGYFAQHSLGCNVLDVWRKVWLRLIVPALIWSGASLAIHLRRGYDRGFCSLVVDSLRDVWFLYCVAFLYLLGCMVFKTGKWKYVVAVSLAAIGYAVYKVPGVVYIEYFQPIRMWPLFVMGLAYREYKQKITARLSLPMSIASIIAYAGIMLWSASSHSLENLRTHENYLLRAGVYQTGAIAWFVLLGSLYKFMTKFPIAWGAAASLGRNTMGIYVIHGKILLLIVVLLPLNRLQAVPIWVVAIVLTALSYAVAIIFRKNKYTAKYLMGE